MSAVKSGTCVLFVFSAHFYSTVIYLFFYYIIFQSVLPGHAAVASCQNVSAVSLAARPRLGFQVWTENLLSAAVCFYTSRTPPACSAASETSLSCLNATVKSRGEERRGVGGRKEGHARDWSVFPHLWHGGTFAHQRCRAAAAAWF